MYITVMDFSTETITKIVWNVEEAETEQVEILLELAGYHLSQISYMVTQDEPDCGEVEVTDILEEETINNLYKHTKHHETTKITRRVY